jgi:23S rRNA (adenine2503-C2)-methyltransferase
MAEYGERFYLPGDRKITLNFALANEKPVDPKVLLNYFSPDKFLIKITPLNPTYRASENELETYIDPLRENGNYEVVESLRSSGYQVILAIGEVEENNIGSNCGQFVKRHLASKEQIINGYTYCVEDYI